MIIEVIQLFLSNIYDSNLDDLTFHIKDYGV